MCSATPARAAPAPSRLPAGRRSLPPAGRGAWVSSFPSRSSSWVSSPGSCARSGQPPKSRRLPGEDQSRPASRRTDDHTPRGSGTPGFTRPHARPATLRAVALRIEASPIGLAATRPPPADGARRPGCGAPRKSEFVSVFQEIRDLRDDAVVGYEALLRLPPDVGVRGAAQRLSCRRGGRTSARPRDRGPRSAPLRGSRPAAGTPLPEPLGALVRGRAPRAGRAHAARERRGVCAGARRPRADGARAPCRIP